MDTKLVKVALEHKSILRNLMELYIYDFTEFTHDDVNEHGLFDYDYLDQYFVEEDRRAFFIRVDGKLAGFALAHDWYNAQNVVEFHWVAEFFVMRKYRHQGVGKAAAFQLFDTRPGEWRLGEIPTNLPAQAFWRKILAEYSGGQVRELKMEGWDGPVQSVLSRAKG